MTDHIDQTETDRICNRHKARLLCQLEEANCPAIYIQAVRNEIEWLRKDLKDMEAPADEQTHRENRQPKDQPRGLLRTVAKTPC